jgi:hypothetical protein
VRAARDDGAFELLPLENGCNICIEMINGRANVKKERERLNRHLLERGQTGDTDHQRGTTPRSGRDGLNNTVSTFVSNDRTDRQRGLRRAHSPELQ